MQDIALVRDTWWSILFGKVIYFFAEMCCVIPHLSLRHHCHGIDITVACTFLLCSYRSLVMHWMGHLRLASGMRPASASTGSYGGTPRHSASSLSLGSRSSLSNIGLTSRGSSSAMNYADTGSARSQRHGSASRSGRRRKC